jgi:hypothetical protein
MRTLLSVAASLMFAAPALAQNCDSNPLFVLTGPTTIPLGGSDVLMMNTQHSIPSLLFVSLGGGPTDTPYGTFCLDFPVPFVYFFLTDASGMFSLPINVPNNPALDCLQIFLQFAVCNTSDPTQRGISNHIVIELGGPCIDTCPEASIEDPLYSTNGGGHAFYIPGLGIKYVFINDSGLFHEHVTLGTAELTGIIENEGEPGNQWDVHVDFSVRINPGDIGYPPAGSPKKELDPSAYIENGGPIDTSTWYYYEVTQCLLTGLGNNAGAVVNFVRMGPAFQVGFGANGKNLNFGASGWLQGTYTDPSGTDHDIYGDINIDLNPCQ